MKNTVLLARLSETQFLIRVSINDFWGAIAIGFVADLLGIKILQKILSGADVGKGNASGHLVHPVPHRVVNVGDKAKLIVGLQFQKAVGHGRRRQTEV